MEQLTHQTARSLLQSAADTLLSPAEQSALDDHLSRCPDCRSYAGRLSQIESDLRRLTHQRWDKQKPSLDLAVIKRRGKSSQTSFMFSGRLALATVLLLAIFLASSLLARFPASLIDIGGSAAPLPGLPSATPTAQPATATLFPSVTQTCQTVLYIVQPDDTLDGIASRFGISKQSILENNTLGSESLTPSMKLLIPICGPAPSGTVTPTNTSTPMSSLPGAGTWI